ncbi:MAG TPA: CHASE2 domain-containing protein [Geobacteraceae bacterium]
MDFLAVRKALLAKPERLNGRIFLSGLCITALLVFLNIYKTDFFRFLDFKLYDTQLRSLDVQRDDHAANGPVIVDIDEKSLAQFGQWPWPRYRLGLLLKKLHEMGVASVGLDMFFPEVDRTSLAIVQREVEREFAQKLDLGRIPATLTDNDAALADVLSRGPYVLAYKFIFAGNDRPSASWPQRPVNAAVIGASGGAASGAAESLFRAKGAVCSIDKLARAAPSAGFFNVTPDIDGVLRRAPLLVEYRNGVYPSLALATVMQATGAKQLFLKTAHGRLESIVLDGTGIPVDSQGNLLIRFKGRRGSFPSFSARDILMDRVPPGVLKGKIVLLGTSATALEDYRTTPQVTVLPGMEVHAAIVDNILKKEFLSRPDWVVGLELALLLIFGIISAFLMGWTRSVLSLCLAVICAVGLWFASGWILRTEGLFISPLFPMMALGVNFSFLTFLKYRRESAELRVRNGELVAMQNFTIQCLAALTETRDSETGGHIIRCQHYVRILANGLAKLPKYSKLLNEETVDLLYKSAPLHDIGKVGVPDRILLKADRLTDDEFMEMKKHTIYGREAICRAERVYGRNINGSFLQFGKEMAYSHHEKWDGSGYPEGLAGEKIPVFARIMAIADVYDALIRKRRYKPSFTHEEAVAMIARSRGSHFDPDVVDAFQGVKEEFRQIALEFPDV